MLNDLRDRHRRGSTQKKGADFVVVTLDEAGGTKNWDMGRLSELVTRLEQLDKRRAAIWQARYLVGLSIDELREVFTLGTTSIHKELRAANAWLRYQLDPNRKK